MTEPLVYPQTVEALIRALGDKLDADAERQMAEAGINVHDVQAVSPQVWHQATRVGAKVLCPDAPVEVGQFELGKRFVPGFEGTLLGRGTLALARVVGPRRSLQRMKANFRNGNNYTETRLVELGPNRYEMWVSNVVGPEFVRGMILAGLEVSGARHPRVETASFDEEGTTYRISWDER
ncbi:MAG TPA: DUF2378 family protein [Myxococcaceae bacterium]|nr:DUF2378 family protein [Myxococcaceae bacterium]